MNNPFLVKYNQRDDYYHIDENASINKVVLAKLPVEGIEDDLKGEKAGYIFNAKNILQDIKNSHKELKIDITNLNDFDIMKEAADRFMDEDEEVRNAAINVAKKYGYRLGLILLTLKTGLKENREARDDWQDEHWEYFANLDRVILAGGLTHTVFGEKLRVYANEVFKIAGVKPYDLLLFNNAAHLGVKGCATLVKERHTSNLIFDFGQTRIKRSLITVNKGEITNQIFLESVDSKYMQFATKSLEERKEIAENLHVYIKNIIKNTFEELSSYNIGNEIIISIASYVIDGKLNDHRGGYAKLSSLTDNYEKYLTKELEKELNRPINIKFVHDGTAIALYFKEYKNTVCLSLGTAIGVGYPS